MKKTVTIIMAVCILVLLSASSPFQLPTDIHSKSSCLLERARKSKGEVIGTAGKGVVALRFDDYQDVFGEKIYPLLIARGLPCSMALISKFNKSQAWGKRSTWDEVRTWNRNGVEIWSHGTDHNDYSINGDRGLYNQIVTSKLDIEVENIKVVGWVLPGVTPLMRNLPFNGLTKPKITIVKKES